MNRPGAGNFWRQVDASGESCWPWVGRRLSFNGYGRVKVAGIEYRAHRYSWLIHNGLIPEGVYVLHSCDNPPCVNPAHLFLGTAADNTADMMRKGRARLPAPETAAKGERNGASRLRADQVLDIRRKNAAGQSQLSLAKDYGVTQGAIWGIVHNRTWAALARLRNEEPA